MLISGERISNPTFSEGLFEMACEPLITTIASTDPEDIEISYGIETSPQRSAFCCFLELAVATDEQALEPILEVVQENHTNEDWRLWLVSDLLLYCATKVESFSQILPALEIFFDRGAGSELTYFLAHKIDSYLDLQISSDFNILNI